MEMRPGMIIENTVLPGSRLRLSCGEVKSPAKCTFSQSNNSYNTSKLGLKFWSGIVSKFFRQFALC